MWPLLKGLPRLQVSATWVPWTYGHLTRAKRLRRSITAPGWYDFSGHLPPQADRATGWLSRVARCCARAPDRLLVGPHHRGAIRLSDALAAMRGHSTPGLDDMDEAVRTTVFMGDATPLQLIHSALTVSQRLGQVPPDVPAVPCSATWSSSRKACASNPRRWSARSNSTCATPPIWPAATCCTAWACWALPGGGWVVAGAAGAPSARPGCCAGEPELSVKLIEASRYGSTVANAATACITEQCQTLESLPALAALVDQALLADLEAAVHAVSASLQSRAATTGDALQLDCRRAAAGAGVPLRQRAPDRQCAAGPCSTA